MDFDWNAIGLLVFFVAYGYIEAVPLYGSGWQPPDNNTFLGYFSRSYHIPLFFIFLGVCVAAGHWYLLFAGCQIEDMFYFIFSKNDSITDKSWITAGLDGVTILGQFIPTTYFLLWLATAGAWFLNSTI